METGPTLLWIGCGSCSGESMAVLGVQGQVTDLADFLDQEGVTLLWHPSLSLEPLAPIAGRVLERKVPLTLLCIEGSLAMGPHGTGLFDTFAGQPKRDVVHALVTGWRSRSRTAGSFWAPKHGSTLPSHRCKSEVWHGTLGRTCVLWLHQPEIPPQSSITPLDGGETVSKRITFDMNRVERDLEVQLEVESDVIRESWCVGTMYRGYEQVLVGRAPSDALVIVPRICGICSTSHLYAGVRALEDAWGVQPAPNGVRVRNLCLLAEAVMNDARQTFLMFCPDFCHPV
jgi:hypothetical protein